MDRLSSSIFREYDVRGRYPEELDEEAARRIGAAFTHYLSENGDPGAIVVGFDARTSSETLFQSFVRGARKAGRDVIDIGLATSPLFYFSVVEADAAGGAMITASHNPAEWNGVKLVRRGGLPVYGGDGLPRVAELAEMTFPDSGESGAISTARFGDHYIDFLVSRADLKKPLRMVADASNGSSGFLLNSLFEKLNIGVKKLFFEPDGQFSNHSPNPLMPDAIRAASAAVLETRADLGCIFDADADRAVFLDERGQAVSGSALFAFLMDRMLGRGETAVATVFASRILQDVAERKGAKLAVASVGHANVKAKMRADGARMGGEVSGHYYWSEFHDFDSALLTCVYVLNFISQGFSPFSELLRPFTGYFNSGEINFKVDPGVVERLKNEYADGRQTTIDGLRVDYGDWWFAVRPSKTEPVVRLMVEAASRELFDEKVRELRKKITE